MTQTTIKRLPSWLRRNLPAPSANPTHEVLNRFRLNTVCESALCPNRTECYSRSTATFMILGDVCTRRCGFCAIETGKGLPLMPDEPERVAAAAKAMNLKYVVVTSVARDDLPDEGANHFVRTIAALRSEIAGVNIEVLTPDFHAREELIALIVAAKPDVFNHNLETVARLQKQVRPQAAYERSLEVIRTIKRCSPAMTTKSGLMLGLGEAEEEVIQAARDLRQAGCDILTLGQYLPPSKEHLPVVEYKTPECFEALARQIKPMGFQEVFSGAYVRSSYHAGELFIHSKSS